MDQVEGVTTKSPVVYPQAANPNRHTTPSKKSREALGSPPSGGGSGVGKAFGFGNGVDGSPDDFMTNLDSLLNDTTLPKSNLIVGVGPTGVGEKLDKRLLNVKKRRVGSGSNKLEVARARMNVRDQGYDQNEREARMRKNGFGLDVTDTNQGGNGSNMLQANSTLNLPSLSVLGNLANTSLLNNLNFSFGEGKSEEFLKSIGLKSMNNLNNNATIDFKNMSMGLIGQSLNLGAFAANGNSENNSGLENNASLSESLSSMSDALASFCRNLVENSEENNTNKTNVARGTQFLTQSSLICPDSMLNGNSNTDTEAKGLKRKRSTEPSSNIERVGSLPIETRNPDPVKRTSPQPMGGTNNYALQQYFARLQQGNPTEVRQMPPTPKNKPDFHAVLVEQDNQASSGQWTKQEEGIILHLAKQMVHCELKVIAKAAYQCGVHRQPRAVDKKLKRLIGFKSWKQRVCQEILIRTDDVINAEPEYILSNDTQRKITEAVKVFRFE